LSSQWFIGFCDITLHDMYYSVLKKLVNQS